MIVKVNLLYLAEHKLTAHQYIILKLISLNKARELKAYLKHSNTWDNILEEIKQLKELGFINDYSLAPFSLTTVVLSGKFAQTHGFRFDGFMELYNEYPTKVTRPTGKEEYLRLNREECRSIYNHIVDDDLTKHQKLLNALANELDYRKRNNSMMYMRKFKNWLASGEWEKFTGNNDEVNSISNTTKYGEEIE
jgi:hypothetical protein